MSVNSSQYKSIVHELYVLSIASVIMLQHFKNYLRFSGTGNKNSLPPPPPLFFFLLFVFFLSDSPFRKYKHNENLI